ncbi:hypothetical protein BJ875DRAFT_483526 [Amylocarpus encephaloides]|uniref:Uncharacterized protein n=1 Tax=Amylocarpus encephaloides TaxID=45428 RepID=A0A9P8C5W9_9HELO|nr:hypothetical protein BJ875DRAFT_483526 [Amylocarpus encephaloides]
MRNIIGRAPISRVKDRAESLPHLNEKENAKIEKYLLLPRTLRPTRDPSSKRVRGVLALRSISDNAQSQLPREADFSSDHVRESRDLRCSEANNGSLSDTEILPAELQHVSTDSTEASQRRGRAKTSPKEPVFMDLRLQEPVQDVDKFGTGAFPHLSDSHAVPAIGISNSNASSAPGWFTINAAHRYADVPTDLPTTTEETPLGTPFEIVPSVSQHHSSQPVNEAERTNVVTSELSSHEHGSPRCSETFPDRVKKSTLHLAQNSLENDPFVTGAETGTALARKFREDASRWWRRVVEPSTSLHAKLYSEREEDPSIIYDYDLADFHGVRLSEYEAHSPTSENGNGIP